MDDLDKIKELLKSDNSRHKQYGQSVEPGYFDELEKKINLGLTQKKSEENTEQAKRKPLYISLIKYGSVAAAVALLFVGLNLFNNPESETFVDNSNTEITDEIIDADYILESEDIYTEDFADIDGIDAILDELEAQLNK